ncbi:hypothetical protein BD413DRAFT_34186 [Trametes elegans]|nr:hypothetical protein BD413DRAFT_34186 [Trametes elegans]
MPLELNGYTAHICCDDKELEMYDIEVEKGNTVTCWIPSEEGKTFTLHWGDESASTKMSVGITVDGRSVTRMSHDCQRDRACTGVHAAAGLKRPFVFSRLVLTDDDDLAHVPVCEALGTIKLAMHRVQYFINPRPGACAFTAENLGPVHEKSKKAGAHTVFFGAAQKACTTVVTAVGSESVPFATFIFRYRPMELLRAHGIAPPLPMPSKGKKRTSNAYENPSIAGSSKGKKQRVDTAVKPEPDDEDDEDEDGVDRIIFLEMVMLQKQLEKARAGRKTAKKVVKREPSPIRVPLSVSQEVIDLT